ncbi:MAG: DNA replication/repair protein RecF [Dehalococcoidia bacterium]
MKIYLSKLQILGFRNHLSTELNLSEGLSVFYGNNGHGKSSLLEAIYMLSIAKSHKSSSDKELINWLTLEENGHMQILGISRNEDITTQAQIDIDASNKDLSFRKGLRINGIKCNSFDFVGNINSIFFEAEDIEIIYGGPSKRRRYLDILIGQSVPSYLKDIQRYKRVIAQKNKLLRSIREKKSDKKELTFWNERLAYEGSKIIDLRRKSISFLSSNSINHHIELSGGEEIELKYKTKITSSKETQKIEIDSLSNEEIESKFLETLIQNSDNEVRQGISVYGPHRDDIEILFNNRLAGKYASRGQARTIAFALKLSEAIFVENTTGRVPIIILDDILSELDPNRRNSILEIFKNYQQVILTVTESELLPNNIKQESNIYNINSGKVKKKTF